MNIQQHNPPHPGAFIRRVYIDPFDLGSNAVAKKLQVSASTFNRLLNEKSSVSSEMALKLSKVLGRSPESWMMMQSYYDLHRAKSRVDLRKYKPIRFDGQARA